MNDSRLTMDELRLIQWSLRSIIAGSILMDKMIGATADDRFKAEQLTALENKLLVLIDIAERERRE